MKAPHEYLLGNDLGVSGRYNLGKKLNERLAGGLRGLYDRAHPYLSTVDPRRSSYH